MFDEMPNHYLATNTRTTSNTFCLDNVSNFDASSYYLQNPQLEFLQLQQQQQAKDGDSRVVEPWSNEEVLALLKIISSLDNPWFPPEFTWDNVSRKMAEIGFKRDAKKCKEKFEEETRSFNNNTNTNKLNIVGQNYRLFGELEELYNSNDPEHEHEHEHEHGPTVEHFSLLSRKNQSPCNDDEDGDNGDGDEDEKEVESMDDDSEETGESRKKMVRKRKRHKKFEMFKGFCEKIVNKMIAQQEELHCKILQDMIKRDEEKIVKEDAWKKLAIDRISKEMEIRAHEQANLCDRQAKILEFLKSFSCSNDDVSQLSIGKALEDGVVKVPDVDLPSDHTRTDASGDHVMEIRSPERDNNKIVKVVPRVDSMSASGQVMEIRSSERGNNKTLKVVPRVDSLSDHTSTDVSGHDNNKKDRIIGSVVVKDDTGRRWPRDEVLALINIRCSLFNNNGGDSHDKENFSKGPLWERISSKMMDLSYDRSAKRCKEKWENINKYFRKTKDLNKKRSIDSRTCPYFHQLSHLYNQQGPLHGQSDHPTCLAGSSDNHSMPSMGSNSTSNVANEVTLVQMSSGFGFDFQ